MDFAWSLLPFVTKSRGAAQEGRVQWNQDYVSALRPRCPPRSDLQHAPNHFLTDCEAVRMKVSTSRSWVMALCWNNEFRVSYCHEWRSSSCLEFCSQSVRLTGTQPFGEPLNLSDPKLMSKSEVWMLARGWDDTCEKPKNELSWMSVRARWGCWGIWWGGLLPVCMLYPQGRHERAGGAVCSVKPGWNMKRGKYLWGHHVYLKVTANKDNK